MNLDMKNMVPLSRIPSAPGAAAEVKNSSAGGFGEMLKQAVNEVNQGQVDSDKAVEQLHTGKAKNIHEVMIALEKADISMRLMVQMRNKIVDAYQEVMRMQV
jgi:flagellar hook-basal body complex protein FliE